MPLLEWVKVDPAELLPMYDDSDGSMTLMLGEADRRLDLADAVPVMDSRASMRFLRCFTSSPVRNDRHVLINFNAATEACLTMCLCLDLYFI